MFSWATGTFTVLRNTEETETDDDQDIGELVASHIPLGLRPAGDLSADPNSLAPRSLTLYAGRAPAGLDLQAGDRIRNEVTDEKFSVSVVRRSPNMVGRRGLKFSASKLN